MRMLKGPKATDFQLQLESYACEGKSCTSVAKYPSGLIISSKFPSVLHWDTFCRQSANVDVHRSKSAC